MGSGGANAIIEEFGRALASPEKTNARLWCASSHAKAILKNPTASNREIADKVGVSAPTVIDTRAEMSVQNVKLLQNEHLPVERAKKVLADNPKLTIRAAAKVAKTSVGTIQRTCKQMEASGSLPKNEPNATIAITTMTCSCGRSISADTSIGLTPMQAGALYKRRHQGDKGDEGRSAMECDDRAHHLGGRV